jgi:pantothenate synthetase
MAEHIDAEPRFGLDYAEVVDPVTLDRLSGIESTARLLVAARLGTPRLLDNLEVSVI